MIIVVAQWMMSNMSMWVSVWVDPWVVVVTQRMMSNMSTWNSIWVDHWVCCVLLNYEYAQHSISVVFPTHSIHSFWGSDTHIRHHPLSTFFFSIWVVFVYSVRCDFELWPRDLDLWPLILITRSRRASPRSKSVRNLTEIGQSAAELLQFEYLTLWPWTCIACCGMLWDSLQKVYAQTSYEFIKCDDFYANTPYHSMTLTFDPLTFNFSGRSGVMYSIYVPNLIEIEQYSAALYIIWRILASITSRCDLNLWPIVRSTYVPNFSEIDHCAAELLMINDRFFVRFGGSPNLSTGDLKTRRPICTKFGWDIIRSSLHTKFKKIWRYLARFPNHSSSNSSAVQR